jgi:hypothetical protein
VRSAVARDFIDVDLRDAVELGLIVGPCIIASGPGITITGGHIHETAMEVGGVDEVRKAVRYQIKRRVDRLKLMLCGGVATADHDVQAEQFTDATGRLYDERRQGLYRKVSSAMRIVQHTTLEGNDGPGISFEERARVERVGKISSTPGGDRTPDLLVRSQALCPAELRAHC